MYLLDNLASKPNCLASKPNNLASKPNCLASKPNNLASKPNCLILKGLYQTGDQGYDPLYNFSLFFLFLFCFSQESILL